MLREPPDILITTPESLFLVLTSQAREMLRSIRWVIIDEIHSLAPNKRGAHLAISLERLSQLAQTEPQRIGHGREPDVNEDAVFSVNRGRTQGFALDRDDAFALFAG